MGNTFFYQEADKNADKITWKEIFSECRKKHTRADIERALMAGTSMDKADETNMLSKWNKPWLFYPLLKGGIVFLIFLYVVYFLTLNLTGDITTAAYIMVIFFPPLITPVVLMIFLWELNIPRNISIYELIGFFLVGGLISFTVVSMLFGVFPEADASNIQTQSQLNDFIFDFSFGAAAREELAKLAAGICMLLWCASKNKKIYGLTGLVVGAAVGAGFGGFGSVSYAMNSGMDGMIRNQLLRAVLAVGGHVLYAAPYLAAVALEMTDGHITSRCFVNKNFILTFSASFALHFAWDYVCFLGDIQYVGFVIITILLWVLLLYITRQCLQQAVRAGRHFGGGAGSTYYNPDGMTGVLVLEWINGPLHGKILQLQPNTSVLAGRDPGCQIRFPQGTKGISRQHCSFTSGPSGWCITDLNSTYGTWMGDGRKLVPGVAQTLHKGHVIYLASKDNALRIK